MTRIPHPDAADVRNALAALWPLLTEAQQRDFCGAAEMRHYRRNETIYDAGQTPEYLLCLASGKAKVFRDGVGGRNQLLRLLRAGQCFGYRSALVGGRHTTTAAAIEASQVCAVPMHLLRAALETNLALNRFFLARLANLLGEAERRAVSIAQKHVRARLAESILLLRQTYGVQDDGSTIDVSISRKDLGYLSNMTTANAIRTLSAFRSEGLVTVEGQRISIADEAALVRVSDAG